MIEMYESVARAKTINLLVHEWPRRRASLASAVTVDDAYYHQMLPCTTYLIMSTS